MKRKKTTTLIIEARTKYTDMNLTHIRYTFHFRFAYRMPDHRVLNQSCGQLISRGILTIFFFDESTISSFFFHMSNI